MSIAGIIPADILTALLAIALFVIPTWLVLLYAGRAVARKRARLDLGDLWARPSGHGRRRRGPGRCVSPGGA